MLICEFFVLVWVGVGVRVGSGTVVIVDSGSEILKAGHVGKLLKESFKIILITQTIQYCQMVDGI